jgi:hypothetical protein
MGSVVYEKQVEMLGLAALWSLLCLEKGVSRRGRLVTCQVFRGRGVDFEPPVDYTDTTSLVNNLGLREGQTTNFHQNTGTASLRSLL